MMKGAIKIESRMSKSVQSGVNIYLSFDLEVYPYRKHEITDFPELLLKVMKLTKNTVTYMPITVWDTDKIKWVETGYELFIERKGNFLEVRNVVRAGEKQTVYPSLASAIEELFDENLAYAELVGKKRD